MKTLLISILLFATNIVLAGNENGGGSSFVPDESSEAVLFSGVKGDEVEINVGKFDASSGWQVKAHLISFKELQKVDVKVGNAINASALSKNWEIVK